MGVAEVEEVVPRCSGFSEARLEAVRQLAGGDTNYINRVGQFLIILGHLLEDAGYTCFCSSLATERGGRRPHCRDPAVLTSPVVVMLLLLLLNSCF